MECGAELWGAAGGASRGWNMGVELHGTGVNATQDRNTVAELHEETGDASRGWNMGAELHAETADTTQG